MLCGLVQRQIVVPFPFSLSPNSSTPEAVQESHQSRKARRRKFPGLGGRYSKRKCLPVCCWYCLPWQFWRHSGFVLISVSRVLCSVLASPGQERCGATGEGKGLLLRWLRDRSFCHMRTSWELWLLWKEAQRGSHHYVEIPETLLCSGVDGALEQVAQRICRLSILGDSEKLSGHGLGQPTMGGPAEAGAQTRRPPEVAARSLCLCDVCLHRPVFSSVCLFPCLLTCCVAKVTR